MSDVICCKMIRMVYIYRRSIAYIVGIDFIQGLHEPPRCALKTWLARFKDMTKMSSKFELLLYSARFRQNLSEPVLQNPLGSEYRPMSTQG